MYHMLVFVKSKIDNFQHVSDVIFNLFKSLKLEVYFLMSWP